MNTKQKFMAQGKKVSRALMNKADMLENSRNRIAGGRSNILQQATAYGFAPKLACSISRMYPHYGQAEIRHAIAECNRTGRRDANTFDFYLRGFTK